MTSYLPPSVSAIDTHKLSKRSLINELHQRCDGAKLIRDSIDYMKLPSLMVRAKTKEQEFLMSVDIHNKSAEIAKKCKGPKAVHKIKRTRAREKFKNPKAADK